MSNRDEDTLKAELRALTAQTRKLREELTDMVSSGKQNSSRSLLHVQRFPKGQPIVDHAPDQDPRPRKKKRP